jgi:flagella basal body P-ring formation protein FlgA
MKKLLSILLILLVSSLSQEVKAQSAVTTKLIPIIEAAQAKELKAKGYNDVEVSVLNIPIENLILPEGNISVKINNIQDRFVSKEYKKVDIFVNSKYQRSIGVPMEMKIYQNVLVSKEVIPRDSLISYKNTEVKRLDILSLTQNVLEEKSFNKEIIATKMYRAGEPIDRRFSKSKPDIIKNSPVMVVFKADDGMSITVDAVALIEGNIGDMVSAQNKVYKRVYMGRVVGPNKILVEI